DALLLVRIGPRDDRLGPLVAGVGRHVRHPGGDVHEVAGLDQLMVLEPRPVPELDPSAHEIDRRLVVLVHVRSGALARLHGQPQHADALRAGRFGRDPGAVVEPLVTRVRLAGTDDRAFGHRPEPNGTTGRVYP